MSIKSNRKDRLTRQEIEDGIRRHHAGGLPTLAIASRMGLAVSTVLSRLRRMGLKPHPASLIAWRDPREGRPRR